MKDIKVLRNELREVDLSIEKMRNEESEIELKIEIIEVIKRYEDEFNHIYLIQCQNDLPEDVSYNDFLHETIEMILNNELTFSEILV